MDKNTIATLARQMESKEDLLFLLNLIKQDEMAQAGMSEAFRPFTMQHINYYCNPNHAFHRYKQFYISKKSGGWRKITAPRNPSFKAILHYTNEIFKAVYTPSDHAMGFAEGRSVATNAAMHQGQNYVFNIDLKDFFPSIDQARVWKRLQLQPICIKKPMANILAGLCAMKQKDDAGNVSYVLPQGAPTSPIISNMVCDTLDRRLAGLARRFGLNYSRYADDITFSSMHNVYQTGSEFRLEMERIIASQGFRINEAKTRLQKIGARQEVTGIIVSEKLNVPRNYVRNLRNILYIWQKHGYSIAHDRFIRVYPHDFTSLHTPDMINVIDGKLMYLKMVKGESDSVYKRMKTQFDKMVAQYNNPYNTSKLGVTCFETMPLLAFEKKRHTQVTFHTADHKLYSLSDEEDAAETTQTNVQHHFASFTIGHTKHLATVKSSVRQEDEQHKDRLAISYCHDASGNRFWLVHLLPNKKR